MIHAPSAYVSGTSSDLKSRAKLLESMEQNFISKLKQRTGLSEKDAKKYLVGDNWIDAKEAKSLGLVSEVVDPVLEPKIKIEDPKQLGQQEVFNAFASLLPPKQVNNPKIISKMKQLLIAAFALSTVTEASSDTVVLDALKEMVNGLKTAKTNAEASLVTARQELDTFKENQVKQVVETYAKGKQITEDHKNALINIGKTSGLDSLQAVLGTSAQGEGSKSPGIADLIQNDTQADAARADWNWDKWQKEDPRGLEKLAEKSPEAYQKLYNAKYQA